MMTFPKPKNNRKIPSEITNNSIQINETIRFIRLLSFLIPYDELTARWNAAKARLADQMATIKPIDNLSALAPFKAEITIGLTVLKPSKVIMVLDSLEFRIG